MGWTKTIPKRNGSYWVTTNYDSNPRAREVDRVSRGWFKHYDAQFYLPAIKQPRPPKAKKGKP